MVNDITEIKVWSNMHFIDLIKGFSWYLGGKEFNDSYTLPGFTEFLIDVTVINSLCFGTKK